MVEVDAAAVRVTSMDPCKRTGAAGPLQAHGLSWVATFASTATGQCTHLGKARRCTTLLPCCPQEHTVAADPPRWWPGYRRAAQGSTPPAGCERGASTANPHPPPAHMRSRSSYLAETAASSGRRAAASDSAAFGERLACCAVLPPNFPPNKRWLSERSLFYLDLTLGASRVAGGDFLHLGQGNPTQRTAQGRSVGALGSKVYSIGVGG